MFPAAYSGQRIPVQNAFVRHVHLKFNYVNQQCIFKFNYVNQQCIFKFNYVNQQCIFKFNYVNKQCIDNYNACCKPALLFYHHYIASTVGPLQLLLLNITPWILTTAIPSNSYYTVSIHHAAKFQLQCDVNNFLGLKKLKMRNKKHTHHHFPSV